MPTTVRNTVSKFYDYCIENKIENLSLVDLKNKIISFYGVSDLTANKYVKALVQFNFFEVDGANFKIKRKNKKWFF